MNRTIMITGISGCGKSTMIRKLKNNYDVDIEYKFIHPETGKKYNYYGSDNHVYILGKYEKRVFGGVDSFSPKAAMIDLIEYIKEHDKDAIILCEGWVFKRYNFDEIIFLDVNNETLRKRLYTRSLTSKRKFNNEHFDNNIHKWQGFKRSMVGKWKAILLPYNDEKETNDAYNKIIEEIDNIIEQNNYFDFLQ